jgi:serine protease inhibitor
VAQVAAHSPFERDLLEDTEMERRQAATKRGFWFSRPAGIAPLLFAVGLAWGCAGPAAAADFVRSSATQAPGSASAAAEAASAVDAFGFDLLHYAGDGNAVISPASVALALAMARAGAAGETATQMDAVLHGLWASGGGTGIASFDQALNGLSGSFTDANGDRQTVEVRVANASFAQRDLAFVQAYLDALATGFDAGERLADFAADPEAGRKAINSWVNDQTNGRIPELLGSLDNATRLVLVNAIYMKAAWRDPFVVEATTDAAFTKADGTQVTVPTMRHTLDTARYASGAGWQAVELEYGQGPLAMDIVVPADLVAFEKTLDGATWNSIVGALKGSEVDLSLPRFKTETKLQLGDALAALGMPIAFDPDRADFSGMTTQEKLFIAAVVHQANISVDEKGTEGSAATAVVMAGSAAPTEIVHMCVDRPFLFAVRDTASGAIVFLGRIIDPSK